MKKDYVSLDDKDEVFGNPLAEELDTDSMTEKQAAQKVLMNETREPPVLIQERTTEQFVMGIGYMLAMVRG